MIISKPIKWGGIVGKIPKQEDLIKRIGTADVDESNRGNNRLLVFDEVTGKRVYIDLPQSAIWGAIVGNIVDQEDLKLKLQAEKRLISFIGNLDAAFIGFVSPINVISFELFVQLASISYASALDSTGVFVNHTGITQLQAWIDTNIVSGTKWLLKLTANYQPNAVNSTYAQMNYHSTEI